jgi:hypothetical protein
VLTGAGSRFHGELSYADNWDAWAKGEAPKAISDIGLDAYPPFNLPDSVVSAAVACDIAEHGDSIDPEIQRKWFAAACQSARSLGMAGLYYWSVSSTDPMDGHSDSPGSFVGRGDSAIKACFASPWHVG